MPDEDAARVGVLERGQRAGGERAATARGVREAVVELRHGKGLFEQPMLQWQGHAAVFRPPHEEVGVADAGRKAPRPSEKGGVVNVEVEVAVVVGGARGVVLRR